MASLGLDYGLIAILAAALAAYYLPFLRRPTGYLLLTVSVAIVTCAGAVIGYAICIFALSLYARLTEHLIRSGGRANVSRWNYACVGMVAALALFLAQSWHPFGRLQFRFCRIPWTLPQHDMWLLVRVISFLWEFGSGRIPTPDFATYLVWIMLPFTSRGPFLRYSEFHPQYLQPAADGRAIPPTGGAWWRRLGLAILQMACGLGLLRLSPVLYALPRRWPKLLIIFGTGPWSFYLSTGGTYHLMECLLNANQRSACRPADAPVRPARTRGQFARAGKLPPSHPYQK